MPPNYLKTQATGMINKNSFKIIAASTAGSAHINHKIPCQDYYKCSIGQNLVAVLSDGAGSARYGKIGAKTLCSHLCKVLKNADFKNIETEIKQAINSVRQILTVHRFNKSQNEQGLSDFSATLVGAIYHQNKGIFFHIGDGAALSLHDNNEFRASLPENGCFACETFFFTQKFWQHNLRFTKFEKAQIIFLMSDGVTSFAFQPDYQNIEPKFIIPINNFLLNEKNSVKAAKALNNTLRTSRAQKLNSDDKTLVWIKVS